MRGITCPLKLQNKAMAYIIRYYDSHSSSSFINKSSLINQNICSPNDVDSLINALVSKELIKYGPSSVKDVDHIQLTDKGRCYFEDLDNENRKQRKETRRFWIGIIKDILIFLFGLLIEACFGIFDQIGL